MTTRTRWLLATLVMLTFGANRAARADQIVFQLEGTATGDINGTSFSGVDLTIVITSDTTRSTSGFSYTGNLGLSSIVYEIGSTSYDSTTASYFELLSNHEFGEFFLRNSTDSSHSLTFFGADPSVLNYDYLSNLGTASVGDMYTGVSFTDSTSGGALTIDSFTSGTFGGHVGSVPEPASLGLLACGIVGVLIRARRRGNARGPCRE